MRRGFLFHVALLALTGLPLSAQDEAVPILDPTCVATILNRNVRVQADGTFAIGNVPIPVGPFRARIICSGADGTRTARSSLTIGVPNEETPLGQIAFEDGSDPLPVSLRVGTERVNLDAEDPTTQLFVVGAMPDGSQKNLSTAAKGTVYVSSNPALATVTADGFVTGRRNGPVVITAFHQGIIASVELEVFLAPDTDGDGISDDFEILNAVNTGGSNLLLAPGVQVLASSYSSGFAPSRLIDGNLQTGWRTAPGDAVNEGREPYVEVLLPQASRVAQIRLLGNRQNPDSFDILSGVFVAYDNSGNELFRSGDLPFPGPSRDVAVAIDRDGVRRLRLIPTADESPTPGFAEMQVLTREGGPGLDRNNPLDAELDFDGDSLSNYEEYNLGTNIFSNDSDGDGLDDGRETLLFSDPTNADTDGDLLPDGSEVSPTLDSDGDGVINLLDADSDGDGLPDGFEVLLGLNPTNADSDGDANPDGSEDGDGDGLVNSQEILQNTDPTDPDTDRDGILDGEETGFGVDGFITHPLRRDTDGDSLPDGWEVSVGLDPTNPADADLDPDGDGVSTREEYRRGSDPFSADSAPPAVVMVDPVAFAVAPINTRVALRFSEELLADSVVAGAINLKQGATALPVELLLSEDRLAVTVRPIGSLQAGTTYTVEVAGVEDASGNPLNAPFSSSFTTTFSPDLTPPEAVFGNPAAGSSLVPAESPFMVAFSEVMDPATLNSQSFTLRDDLLLSNVAGHVQVDAGGRAATFVPATPLARSRFYTLNLDTSVTDLAGEPLASPFAFGISRGPTNDTAGPSVLTTRPAAGATGIARSSRITVVFSEPVDGGSVLQGVRLKAGVVTLGASLALSEGDRVLTLVPTFPLAASTSYQVVFSAAVKDRSGRSLSNPGSVTFTSGTELDGTPPQVLATLPVDGEIGVDMAATVSVTFSESIQARSATAQHLFLTRESDGARVAASVVVAPDGRQATLTPSRRLDPITRYRIHATDAVTDPSGLRLSAPEVVASFETIPDIIPPGVHITAPGDGDGVLAGTLVTVSFVLTDEIDLGTYDVFVDGELQLAVSNVSGLTLNGQYLFEVPASSTPGQRFVLRVEARDAASNMAFDEVEVQIPLAPVLTGNQTLDSSRNGQDLVLGAGTFTVNGPLAPASLLLLSGARVVPLAGQSLKLTLAGSAHVGVGATIDADGFGYAGNTTGANGGAPSWVSASTPDAGGSHGGAGISFSAGGIPGAVYGSVYAPRLGGGGGARDDDGAGNGRAGGGVIEIAAGQLGVNGEIRARGLGDLSNSAGGAGGSVLIDALELHGSGRIDVSGGSSRPVLVSQETGAGGGGRVAIYADRIEGFDPSRQVFARGGSRLNAAGTTTGHAAPGTILFSDLDHALGILVIDNGETSSGDRSSVPTELPLLRAGTVLAAVSSGNDLWITGDQVFPAEFVGAFVRLFAGTTADLGLYRVLDVDGSGRALLASAAPLSAQAASFQGEYHFDRIELRNGAGLLGQAQILAAVVEVAAGAAELPSSFVADDMTLRSGAVASLAQGGILNAVVNGSLNIESGAVLDASGRGYSGSTTTSNGGAPSWVSGSTPDSGGSHGGIGVGFAGIGGGVFDSVYIPQLGGGGGARDDDGAGNGLPGGGVIQLAVGELVLEGEIRALGAGGVSDSAAGAGGTVRITATTLRGGGSIDASGGSNAPILISQETGAGGGGRVALEVANLVGFTPSEQVKVWGGSRRSSGGTILGYAAPGTVFLKTATSTFGDLLIDSGQTPGFADRVGPSTDLPILGSGNVVAFEGSGSDAWVTGSEIFRPQVLGAYLHLYGPAGEDLGSFRVGALDAAGKVLLQGASSRGNAARYEGEYLFDRIDLLHGAGIKSNDVIFGENVVVEPGNAELPPKFATTNLTLKNGAVVTVAQGGDLSISVSERLLIEAGALLDWTGLGFAGSTSTTSGGGAPSWVAGSTPDSGGSHGGVGVGFIGTGGGVFDSVYVPRLGGGGGSRDDDGSGDGLPGGGVITIEAKEVVLNGEIRAQGSGGQNNRAGGAGGTVRIIADTLAGVGGIDASGGANAPTLISAETGSGGGGRVALEVGQFLGFQSESQVKVWGGSRRSAGGTVLGYAAPGTIYVKNATSTYGDLLIASGRTSGGLDRVGPVTELPTLGSGVLTELQPAGPDAWVQKASAFLPHFVGAYLRLSDASGENLGVFRVVDLGPDGRALLAGAAGAITATSYVGEYRFDRVELLHGAGIQSSDVLLGMDVVIEPGNAELPPRFSASRLTLKTGATVTVSQGGELAIEVLGRLEIEPGALLDLTGRGFAGNTSSANGGAPSWVTGSTSDSGGSHGGVGVGFVGNGGDVFDSVYAPQLGGGGGARDDDGAGDGLAGGGVITLRVGELVLGGEIRAQGSGGASNRAGGAGGTVRILADTLSGGGSIDASGGSNAPILVSQETGAGGGGRVALEVSQLLGFDPVAQVRVLGGARRSSGGTVLGYAAPGTLFVKTAASTYGDLVIDSGQTSGGADQVGPSTDLPVLGSGAVTAFQAVGPDAWVTGPDVFRNRFVGAFIQLLDSNGLDLGSFQVAAIGADGRALLTGAAGGGTAARYVGEYRFDRIELLHGAGIRSNDVLIGTDVEIEAGDAELPPSLTAASLTLRGGAVVTVAQGGQIDLRVTGLLEIESGALLDLSGRGYAGNLVGTPTGGAPSWVSASTPDSGGSHGGVGVGFSGLGGGVFDSVYVPHLGGGGGSRDDDGAGDGLAGGGVITLMASQLRLDGEIRSRGLGGVSNRAGGAGGTVRILAETLTGNGLIDASGGDNAPVLASQETGSGGGGRVAIEADLLAGFDPVSQVRVWGGQRRSAGGTVLGFAAAGTLFVKTASSTYGDLLIDSGETSSLVDRLGPATELPWLGTGSIAAFEVDGVDAWVSASSPFRSHWLGAFLRLADAAGQSLGLFRVKALDIDGRVQLEGAGLLAEASTYAGEYHFDRIELRNGAGLVGQAEINAAAMQIAAGNSRVPNTFSADELTLETGAQVTPAQGGTLKILAGGHLHIENGALLDVSALGYPGSTSSVNGGAPALVPASNPDVGGSHGGLGIRSEAGVAGDAYDSVFYPQLGGGGGARDDDGSGDGQPGGGAIEIVAGEVVIDGEIRAWGGGGAIGSSNRAGGAGGGVFISASRLSGSGKIDASGGSARPVLGSQQTGAGGGGRVALRVDELDTFDPLLQVWVRGGSRFNAGGTLTGFGGPGTLFVQEGNTGFGSLIVDQGGTSGLLVGQTPLPTLGSGVVGNVASAVGDPSALWITPQDAGTLFDLGVVGVHVRIHGNDHRVLAQTTDRRQVLLEGAAGLVEVGDPYLGVYKLDQIRVRGGAVLVVEDEPEAGVVEVEPGSTLIDNSP